MTYRQIFCSLFLITVLLNIVAMSAGNHAHGQSYVPLSFQYVAPAGVKAGDVGQSMQFRQMNVGFAVPFSVRRGRLIAGLRYNRVAFEYDGSGLSLSPETVHHVRVEMILQQSFGTSWASTLVASPGWASDFADPLQSGDFNMSLALLFTRNWRNRLTTGLGVSYVENRSPAVLPLVQFYWEGMGPWEANILAPSSAHFWYVPHGSIKMGMTWRAELAPYNLSGLQRVLIRRQVFSVGPAIRLPIKSKVALQLESGMTLRNRIVFKSADESSTFDYDRSWFIAMGIVLGN